MCANNRQLGPLHCFCSSWPEILFGAWDILWILVTKSLHKWTISDESFWLGNFWLAVDARGSYFRTMQNQSMSQQPWKHPSPPLKKTLVTFSTAAELTRKDAVKAVAVNCINCVLPQALSELIFSLRYVSWI